MDNTTVSSETTADVLDVRSPVTRSSKRKEGKDIPESSNLSGSKNISVEESEKEAPLVENLTSKPSSNYQSFKKKIDSLLEYVQEITSKSEEDKELSYKSKYLDSRSQYDHQRLKITIARWPEIRRTTDVKIVEVPLKMDYRQN